MAYSGSKLYSLIQKQQQNINQATPSKGRKLVLQPGTSDRSRHTTLEQPFQSDFQFQTEHQPNNYQLKQTDHFSSSRNSKPRALTQMRVNQRAVSRGGSNYRNGMAQVKPQMAMNQSKTKIKTAKKYNLKVNQPVQGVQALLQTYNSAFNQKTPQKQTKKMSTLNYTANEYTNSYLQTDMRHPPIQQNFNNINVFNEYNINGQAAKNQALIQHQNFFTLDQTDANSKLGGLRSNSVNRRAGNQTINNIRTNLMKQKLNKRDLTPDPTFAPGQRKPFAMTINHGEVQLKHPTAQKQKTVIVKQQAKHKAQQRNDIRGQVQASRSVIRIQDDQMPLITDDQSSYRESQQLNRTGKENRPQEESDKDDYDDFETVESQLALYDIEDQSRGSSILDNSRYESINTKKHSTEQQRLPIAKMQRHLNMSRPKISGEKSKEMSEHLLQLVSNQDLDKMKDLIHKSIQQRKDCFRK